MTSDTHAPGAATIDIRCPICRRTVKNAQRFGHDPEQAVLVEIVCERHPEANQPPVYYYDANGNEIHEEAE